MAKSTSSISFIENSYVGCDDDESYEGCNPFNPDEEEFGDCLFNPDSDLKCVKKRPSNVTVVIPPLQLKRKKHVVINTDQKNNISNKELMIHKKIESSPKNRPSTDVAIAKKIEISPILTTDKPSNMKIEPKIMSKPPLPPKPQVTQKAKPPVSALPVGTNNGSSQKMKRKVEETSNACLVQKLSAQTEQLRLEISLLKTALGQEKNAVRGLRLVYKIYVYHFVIMEFFLDILLILVVLINYFTYHGSPEGF